MRGQNSILSPFWFIHASRVREVPIHSFSMSCVPVIRLRYSSQRPMIMSMFFGEEGVASSVQAKPEKARALTEESFRATV